MNHESDDAVLIRESITYGSPAPTEAIERLGARRTYSLIAAALTVAAQRRFPEGTPASMLRAYADRLPSRFPDGGEAVNPDVAEIVLRAVCGEPADLESLSHGDILGMMFLLTYAIMSYEGLQGEDLDEYIADVIALADEG